MVSGVDCRVRALFQLGENMAPEELGAAAVATILAGTDMTLHLPKGEKWPQGWPRGELLSVSELGKNYSFDPLKVLGFMQRLAKLGNVPQRSNA
jgi:hypothetical protein